MRFGIEYAFPPVLQAGSGASVDVCIQASLPTTSRCILLDVSRQIILNQQFSLPNPGMSTLRFNFSAQLAGACLQLVLSEDLDQSGRRPLSIPLLALPEAMAEELSQYFDHLVKACISAQQAAGSLSTSQDEVQHQNATVGKVYRHHLLPMLRDMQTVLQDRPFHELQQACSRLAPCLHAANMQHSLSVLREVITIQHDIETDLLARPAGLINPPAGLAAPSIRSSSSEAPSTQHPFLAQSPASNTASTHPPRRAVTTALAQHQDTGPPPAAIYHSMPIFPLPGPSPFTPLYENMPMFLNTADECSSSTPLPGPTHHSAPASLPAKPAPEARHPHNAHFLTPTPPPQGVNQEHLLTTFVAEAVYGGMLDTMSSDGDDAGSYGAGSRSSYLSSVMLTSFVPVHHQHAQEDPLHLLVDPDHPASQPASAATSVVGGIMAAGQQGPGSVIMMPSVDSQGSHSEFGAGWQTSQQGAGVREGPDSRDATGWSNSIASGVSAGFGSAPGMSWAIPGWAGLMPPRPGPPPPHVAGLAPSSALQGARGSTNYSAYETLRDGASSEGPVVQQSAEGSSATGAAFGGVLAGGRQPSFGPSEATGVADGTPSAVAAAGAPEHVGRGAGVRRQPARGLPLRPVEDSGLRQRHAPAAVAALSSTPSGHSSCSSAPSSRAEVPSRIAQMLQCVWRGFADSTMEAQFRVHWAANCWLVDATTLGLTAGWLWAKAGTSAEGQLLMMLFLPVLLAAAVLLLLQGQAAAGYRDSIVVLSRISTCVVLLAATHGLLTLDLGLGWPNLATRLALAHLHNLCRPVLLGPALLTNILEAFAMASLGALSSPTDRVLEGGLMGLSTLAVTVAVELSARRSFTALRAMHVQHAATGRQRTRHL